MKEGVWSIYRVDKMGRCQKCLSLCFSVRECKVVQELLIVNLVSSNILLIFILALCHIQMLMVH